MWEALFVTTFQNKDNLLIYTKTFCKSSYKMQKNIISFFCTVIFLQNHKNSDTTQQKLFLSSFLNSFIFLSNSQEKNANLFISNYVYLKFSVFDKTNITLNISTDF